MTTGTMATQEMEALQLVTLVDPPLTDTPPRKSDGSQASHCAAPKSGTNVRGQMNKATRGGYRATSVDQIRGAGDK